MGRVYLRKGAEACLTLFFVATLIFLLMHLAPGSPFLDEHLLSNDSYKVLKAHYGLDKPLIVQYGQFMLGILRGQFGPSMAIEGVSVASLIKEAFPLSLKLGAFAFCLSVILGILLSLALVFSKGTFFQKLAWFLNSSCLALPSFVAAVLLQYIFAIKLNLLPISGLYSFKHLILPAFSLSLIPIGVIARLLKTKLEEVLNSPYTLSAKSKGLGPIRLFFFHLMPGAMLPMLSYLGPLAATLITGSFACEKIFALPGLGSWFVISLNARDYPLIAGLTLFYSLFVIGFSFLVDLVCGFFDPKLKKGHL